MDGVGGAVGEEEHGADLAGGAASDVEEGEEFGGGAALEAFGDIIGNGQGGAAELIAQVAGLGEEAVASQRIDTGGQDHGGFPAR